MLMLINFSKLWGSDQENITLSYYRPSKMWPGPNLGSGFGPRESLPNTGLPSAEFTPTQFWLRLVIDQTLGSAELSTNV